MSVARIERGKYRVQSVGRAAFIVFEVARNPNGLTPREVSEALQIHLQTTYHLLHTLTSTGLLARRGDRYILGLRCAALGEAFKRQLTPPEFVGPAVREIASRTGEAAQAVGWEGSEIVALSIARGAHSVQAADAPYGASGFGHARASGKLLLAFADTALRDEYLKRNPLRYRTKQTITKRGAFELELAKIRSQEYAVDNEEYSDGVCCLAVPLGEGLEQFAIGLSAPAERFHQNVDSYLQELRDIARTVFDAETLSALDGSDHP